MVVKIGWVVLDEVGYSSDCQTSLAFPPRWRRCNQRDPTEIRTQWNHRAFAVVVVASVVLWCVAAWCVVIVSVAVLAAVVQAWWQLLKLHAFHPDVDQASKLL